MSQRSKSFGSFALAVGTAALLAGNSAAQGQRVTVEDPAGFTLTDAVVSYSVADQESSSKAIALGDGTSYLADFPGKGTVFVEHPAYGRYEFELGDGTPSNAVLVISIGQKQAQQKFLATATISDLTAQTPGQPLAPGTTTGCQLPDQMGHGGNGTLFATSDTNALYGHTAADAFQPLADGTITGLTFWGAYYDFATHLTGTPHNDQFTVTYFEDDGSGFGPGAVLAGPFDVTTVATPTGNLVTANGNPVREFQYEAAHPPVDVTAGTSTWIAIQNNTNGTAAWVWSTAGLTDGHASQDSGFGFQPVPFDLGFCVDVATNPTGNGVFGIGGNDSCSSADPISGTGLFAFDNTFASSDGQAHAACFAFGTGAIDNDVWFAWTADADDLYTLQTCSLTGVDTKIAVYTAGTCPGTDATLLACNDDSCALQSSVDWSGESGQTYLLRIGTFPGALGGTGSFSISGAGIGGGGDGGSDDCASADPISGTGSFLFDNSMATTDGLGHAACFAFGTNGIDNDVWFAWTAEATETVTVQTCGLTSVDTKIAVYDSTACPATDAALLGCNDDACALQSVVAFDAINGATYLIRIGTFPGAAGGTGGFEIIGLGSGNNDFCAGATSVAVPSTTAGNTFTATTDAGPDCGGGSAITSPGVWYEVTGTGNTMTASLCSGTNYDSKLSVFCGGCSNLTCVAGNDDFCGLQSQVSWCSEPGASYLILVHGFGGATGSFSLAVSDNGMACTGAVSCAATGACCTMSGCTVESADDCASLGGSYQGDNTACGTFDYMATTCNDPFVSIAGMPGATELVLGDDDSETVALGFPFLFFGNSYTEVTVSSNGYLTFDPTAGNDFSNDPIPSTLDPNLLIAPLWDDLNPAAGGSIWYQSFGPLGARALVVEWNSVPQFGMTDSNTFQVILFSANERVSFRYMDITPEAFFGDYTVGIENGDGTVGVAINASTIGNGDCWDIIPSITGNPCTSATALDVTPGVCPNLFVDSVDGLLSVALLGSTTFDVTQVNLDSLVLSNVGGGPAVFLLQDPYGPGILLADIASPNAVDCQGVNADGLLDLRFSFDTDLVCATLGLDQLAFGDHVELQLSGQLVDGAWFTATDTVVISAAATGKHMSFTSNLENAYVRIDPLDLNQTSNGFANFARTYAAGTQVRLTAYESELAPAFLGWLVNGNFTGANPVLTVYIHNDVTVQAVYQVPHVPKFGRTQVTPAGL